MHYRALRIDQLQQGVCLAYRELALDIREENPVTPLLLKVSDLVNRLRAGSLKASSGES